MTDTLTPDENRTVIAALAMAGMLARLDYGSKEMASDAVQKADALLKALEKAAPQPRFAANDCVKYLVGEAEKDQLAKERIYRPNGKYMVIIKPDDFYPAGKEIAAAAKEADANGD